MSNVIIFEMITASIMSLCDLENSQITAPKNTFGVAGDDNMYHIIVVSCARWGIVLFSGVIGT